MKYYNWIAVAVAVVAPPAFFMYYYSEAPDARIIYCVIKPIRELNPADPMGPQLVSTYLLDGMRRRGAIIGDTLGYDKDRAVLVARARELGCPLRDE
jgi:hypothetical protein